MIKGFKLGAVEWSVKVDNDKLDDKEAYGMCYYDTSTILLQDISNKDKRAKTAVEQTLYHEVIHAILDTMNEFDLSSNEKFVQQFSLLLHQFEVSKKQ